MLTLARFIRRFPGSSLPAEVETLEGPRLIMKMKGAGNGTQSLMAEFLVHRSGLRMGWPLPGVQGVIVPDDFPWNFGTDEFDDILQKSYGLNLGLQYLGDCEALEAETVRASPAAFLDAMASLDAFFLNYDRLPQSRNTLKDNSGKLWLNDHGSCLILDPELASKPWGLPPGHLLGTRPLPDKRMAQRLGEAALLAIGEIPEVWMQELGLTQVHLQDLLKRRLDALL